MKKFNTLLTLAIALATCSSALAQGPNPANENWEETENWIMAFDKVMDYNVSKDYVFNLAADAEKMFISEEGMMLISTTEINDQDEWMSELEAGIFESGSTRFTACSEVKRVAGGAFVIYYTGTIGGEQVMMQRFFYADSQGQCYEAKVVAKEINQHAEALDSASLLVVGLMNGGTNNLAARQ
jgi:hypothetical protein